MFSDLYHWLTAARRQALQAIVAAVVPLFLLANLGTEEMWGQIGLLVGALLTFAASMLSLSQLRKGAFGQGWAIVRAAVYALAATAVPALVTLTLITPEAADAAVGFIVAALTAVGSIVALFTSSAETRAELSETRQN